MVKKNVSVAVQNSVSAIVPVVPVRGPKQFNSDQYLAEYQIAIDNGETWKELEKRIELLGMKVSNVRQTVTNERSTVRSIMLEKANSSPAFMKQLKSVGKDVEVWASEKAEERWPFLKGSDTRNTSANKRREEYASEELSL